MKIQFLLLGVLLSSGVFSQDLETLKAQAKAAGYSDAQIDQAIQSATMGNIPTGTGTKTSSNATVAPEKGNDSLNGKSPVFINAKPEQTRKDSLDGINKPSKMQKFGVDILKSIPQNFEPNDLGPVPDDYVLGTGDELQISVWGQIEIYKTAKIDRSGQIQIPNVGLISVSGLTLEDARNVIKNRMSQSYSGLKSGDSKLSVSLMTIRPIRVFVGGFVNFPGAYRLSGASSILSVLYASGGLKENADFRRINIIHANGQIDSVDVYDNLLGLNSFVKSHKIENNDMIMVPGEVFPIKIAGEINRPGIYDLKQTDDFKKVLSFAGGLTPFAWTANVEIHRIVRGKGIISLSFNADDVISGLKVMYLQPGDSVYVPKSIVSKFSSVQILGSVKQPGYISFKSGLTIKDAVEQVGGIFKWTYLDRAEIVYTDEDSTFTIKSFHLGRALSGDKNENLIVPEKSKIYIKSNWEIKDRETLDVLGFVHKPQSIPYYAGITVGSAIFLAGGFNEYAFEGTIEVSRITKNDSSRTDRELAFLYKINNKGSLSVDNENLNFLLKPYDQVYVRLNPYFIRQKNVILSGEVKFPGPYALESRDEKLSDLILRAGGLKSSAFPEGIIINRSFEQIGKIPINYLNVINDHSCADNIILMPGDEVIIPEQKYTVSVKGATGVQSSIVFVKGKNYKYYIEQAGGFAENADEDRVRVELPNGSIFLPDNYWISDPEVLAGSTIYVPVKLIDDKVDWKSWAQFTASLLTSIVTILILIRQI